MILSNPGDIEAVITERPLSGEISGISIDSRTVKSGEIYVAIKGENFDGHDFIRDAAQKGASAVVISKDWYADNKASVPTGFPLFLTIDTQLFLGQYANFHRKKQSRPVIGITGSNGKTSVKEMAALVISKIGYVHKTAGNLNNHLGVPLTLLRTPDEAEYTVLEMGINHPGEMTYLCSIAEPDVGLITNVALSHTEFFADIDKVASSKEEMFTHMAVGGTAIVNLDDVRIDTMSKKIENKLTFSFLYDADIQGRIVESEKGTGTVLEFNGCEPFMLQTLGRNMASNALAAAAIGLKYAVPIPEIRDALASYKGFKGRMSRTEAAGRTIIDDSYNANPASVEMALKTFSNLESDGKKVVVFGDMLELGRFSRQEHRNVGSLISDLKIDALLTFGNESVLTVEEAKKYGLQDARHFESKKELTEYLMNFTDPGDMILVKGSRGMAMEDVIELMKNEVN